MSVAVINYGSGNLRSVVTALARIGYDAEVTDDRAKIMGARAIVFPGQGAAGQAIEQLKSKELVGTIKDFVRTGKPFLGICLGMQLLLEHHDEDDTTGFGFFHGNVPRFQTAMKVPHMGWNQVQQAASLPLFKGIRNGAYFYFVHSYYALPAEQDVVAGMTEYCLQFASVLARDNIFGTQFHPEKSGEDGLQMLRNFIEVAEKC